MAASRRICCHFRNEAQECETESLLFVIPFCLSVLLFVRSFVCHSRRESASVLVFASLLSFRSEGEESASVPFQLPTLRGSVLCVQEAASSPPSPFYSPPPFSARRPHPPRLTHLPPSPLQPYRPPPSPPVPTPSTTPTTISPSTTPPPQETETWFAAVLK